MSVENSCQSVISLLKIMQRLRDPDGCPWDLMQTPESLVPYILEEACELIEAIETNDCNLILDELGDLLLQVVFVAQIFSERQQFNFYDVASEIAAKLKRRHPHVFTKTAGDLALAELDTQWETIKKTETNYKKSCLADHMPLTLPALQRAQKLITKVDKTGRRQELPDYRDRIDKLDMNKISGSPELIDEETLGQILFQLTKLAHEAGLDAETALRKKTRNLLQELDAK